MKADQKCQFEQLGRKDIRFIIRMNFMFLNMIGRRPNGVVNQPGVNYSLCNVVEKTRYLQVFLVLSSRMNLLESTGTFEE